MDRAEATLSETGCAPLLLSWGTRALYLGPSLRLSAHRNAVAVLAVALEAPFELALDPRRPQAGHRRCTAALIEPNRLHQINAGAGDYAFIYLDPFSSELKALRARCAEQQADACFALAGEDALRTALRHLPRSATAWADEAARSQHLAPLEAALLGEAIPAAKGDARVRQLVTCLHAQPDDVRDLADWAAALGVSESRLQHLVKQETGLPFRRLRLWMRLRAAVLSASGRAAGSTGADLTRAALDAGLASSAHLSAAFREMFGMSPTALLALAPVVVQIDPESTATHGARSSAPRHSHTQTGY
jgi:AraC-like DNA-binding protein